MDITRILIADDHPLMRAALRNAVESEPGLEVEGEVDNGQSAVEMYAANHPNVVLMDLFMPVMDGIEAIETIIQHDPTAKILAITSSNEDDKVVSAIRAGALGYLLKDATRERLVEGIRNVAEGKRYVPPEIGEKLARGLFSEGKKSNPLTRREQEVLELLGKGLSNAVIARQLFLSNSTVRVHIYNILDKLGLEDRNQAVIYAARFQTKE